jgi:uncharacterized membrane protein (DUF485 family)
MVAPVVDIAELRGREIAPDPWIKGVESVEFKTLIDAKQRSIVPMVVIYIVGYMGLSVLAGFGRGILGTKVLGAVNLGFVLIAGKRPSRPQLCAYAMIATGLLALVYIYVRAESRLGIGSAARSRRRYQFLVNGRHGCRQPLSASSRWESARPIKVTKREKANDPLLFPPDTQPSKSRVDARTDRLALSGRSG